MLEWYSYKEGGEPLTWEKLAELINQMTPEEKKMNVLCGDSGSKPLKTVNFFTQIRMRPPIPNKPYIH
jgi:hypothetical protein